MQPHPYTMPRRSLGVAVSNRSRAVADVEIRESGALSICATVSDTAGGYMGGQCLDKLEAEAARIAAEPGGRRIMPAADLAALVSIWRRWHLNDMRAGCEHQTGPDWDASQRVERREFSMDWDDMRRLERAATTKAEAAPNGEQLRRACDAAARVLLLKGASVEPFRWQALAAEWEAVLSQHFEIVEAHELADYRAQVRRWECGQPSKWRGKHRPSWGLTPKPPALVRVSFKLSGQLSHDEHPAGILGKPCQACGYKYGTAWRKEEVPAEVVAELLRVVNASQAAPSESDAFAALGFTLSSVRTNTRPESSRWPADARHWLCRLERNRQVMEFPYTQGSAHKEPPTLAEVLDCLRSDARLAEDEDEAQACGVKLSDWETLKRQAHAFRLVVGDAAEAIGDEDEDAEPACS